MLVFIVQPFAYFHYHGIYYNPKRWSMPTMALCSQQKDGQWQNLLEMIQAYMPCKGNNSGRGTLFNRPMVTTMHWMKLTPMWNKSGATALIELSMQHDHPMVAPKLPSFTSLKSSLYQSQLLLSFV